MKHKWINHNKSNCACNACVSEKVCLVCGAFKRKSRIKGVQTYRYWCSLRDFDFAVIGVKKLTCNEVILKSVL
jgi:hypothetical protein